MKEYYVYEPKRGDVWILAPDGEVLEQCSSRQQADSIVEELNSIKKPTEKQLDALIALMKKSNSVAPFENDLMEKTIQNLGA